MLTNPDGRQVTGGAEKHFLDLADEFYTGTILYGLRSGRVRTLAALNEWTMLSDWARLVQTLKTDAHPAIRRAGEVVSRPGDRELGGLQTTAARALRLWTDPHVARMTARSDFALGDLRNGPRPLTVYLSIPFDDQERVRPLTRLLIRQLLGYATHQQTGWRHPLLALIDEVPGLKHLPILSEGLNFMAGFGVQLVLITPTLSELARDYGEHHNFLEGTQVQVAFGLRDGAVADRFSRRIGTTQAMQTRRTHTPWRGVSTTREVQDVPLLSATGLLHLPADQLLLVAGAHQALLRQARWYEHRTWQARAALRLQPRKAPHGD